MAEKTEFKVTDSWDYKAPADSAQILTLPDRRFAWIEGKGDPNGKEFAQATGALYSLSYSVRMSYRSSNAPKGAVPYTVGVLQGRWDLQSGDTLFDPHNKDKYMWVVMIRQPDFLNEKFFVHFVEEARGKAEKKREIDSIWFDRLRFGPRDGGRFAQIMHIGPYDSEPQTFARLEASLNGQGVSRHGKWHWEIYHSDPRRTAPEKLRTILRVQIA